MYDNEVNKVSIIGVVTLSQKSKLYLASWELQVIRVWEHTYSISDFKTFSPPNDFASVDFGLNDRKWECETYVPSLIQVQTLKPKGCFFGYKLHNVLRKEVEKTLQAMNLRLLNKMILRLLKNSHMQKYQCLSPGLVHTTLMFKGWAVFGFTDHLNP